MEDQMKYIDDFFQGTPTGEEVKKFEEKISVDPGFAADVAFYISAKQAGKELVEQEKKKKFRELYSVSNGHQPSITRGKVRKFWYAAVPAMAAAFLVVFFTIFNNPSPSDLANNYVKKNYDTAPVKMGIGDEKQKAAELYTQGNYTASLSAFENIISKDSTSLDVLKYAGLAALRIPDYNKALHYFKMMENFRGLHSNPAVLFQALTLMKRNESGDKEQVKILLNRIDRENLEGKEQAVEWLKKL